jgi:hypothetical protein
MPLLSSDAKSVTNSVGGSHDDSRYFASMTEVERLVHGFEDGTLPRIEWTHQAHMTVAFCYLSKYSELEATNRIRDGIKKYNVAVGTENARTSGYHETITLFWVWAVRRFMSNSNSSTDPLDSINKLLSSHDKNFPLEYYSKELLMSWDARREWREPDLRKLDAND